MQWNIHGTLGDVSSNSSPSAMALARVVDYNHPDILLLNEVQDTGIVADEAALIDWVTNRLSYLGTMPGVTFWVAVSSIGDGFSRNAAISRYPISNETTYNDGLRGLHAFQVQLPATNLQIFHAHLKCCSTGNSCTEKQTEAQFDADTISSWASTNGLPYIFGGDWNEDEDNPECVLSGSYHPITTIRQFGNLADFKPTTIDGEYRTWSTEPAVPSIRFDYLLAANGRLVVEGGYVFSTMDWAAHGLYTNAATGNLADDSQVASDHYCVVADYAFGVAAAALGVVPATGLESSGAAGGPFSPGGQIYSLTNSGGCSLVWTVNCGSSWLTVSNGAGTLDPGAGATVTVSVNGNANTLAAGVYSDTLSFTNVSNGAGSVEFPVTLIVSNAPGQLVVAPVAAFDAYGSPGGPFNPGSQSFALSNAGGGSFLNWAAIATNSWLSLWPTSGTLGPGSNATITFSINNNASSLAAGHYDAAILFTNLSGGPGSATRSASLDVANFGFVDDFGTFAHGNLAGQQNWLQLGSVATLPLQISGATLVVPAGQTIDNQDAYKNFPQTNATVYYGLTLTVTSAVTNASPSYFTALYTGNGGGGFANYRLTAKAGDAGRTNFVLGARVTGQSGDPYTFGTGTLPTGATCRVIVAAPAGGGQMMVYVNPTGSDIASQTPYLVNPVGGGTPPTSVGSIVVSQFGSASTGPTDGIAIGKMVVAGNFPAVYYNLLGIQDIFTAFQSWQVQYFGSVNNPAADPNADPDEDGQVNWAEYLAGTDPTDGSSVLRIQSLALDGSDIRVSWTTAPLKTNALQVAIGDNGGGAGSNFTDIVCLTTVGAVTNYLDAGAATNSGSRYYRVRLVQ